MLILILPNKLLNAFGNQPTKIFFCCENVIDKIPFIHLWRFWNRRARILNLLVWHAEFPPIDIVGVELGFDLNGLRLFRNDVDAFVRCD